MGIKHKRKQKQIDEEAENMMDVIHATDIDIDELTQSFSELGLAEWNRIRLDGGHILSQKAAALAAYMHEDLTYTRKYEAPQTMFVLNGDNPQDVADWAATKLTDMFTRTCPLNPRHGVLESTRSTTKADDIIAVVENLQGVMLEHDPQGCLMVQPFVECTGSAVLAPGMYIAIGEGHDGITAGHGFSLVLPISPDSYHIRRVLERMGDAVGREYDPELHEIEFVFKTEDGYHDSRHSIIGQHYCDPFLTQVRGCDKHIPIGTPPSGVTINGAVPSGTVEATQVWVMSGLEEVIWLEENITKEKCPEGFVVSEPNGSLLSHICAHCRTHGIPYIIGDVKEGETWTEAAPGWVIENSDGLFEAQPYNPFDYIEAFRQGIEYGNTHWRRKHAYFSTFFHQWMGQPSNDPSMTAYLAGIFTAWMVKACVAACVGEMRHASSQKRNNLPDIPLLMGAILGEDFISDYNHHGNIHLDHRKHYHTWMKEHIVDWDGAAAVLLLLEKMYKTGWASSYGGKRWGAGAAAGAQVATLIEELMACEDDEYLANTLGPKLASAVNVLENAQHNNGNLLNKFGADIKLAYDYGTSGFDESQLDAAFLTYCMAKDVLDDTLEATDTEPVCDWVEVAVWLSSTTANGWRETPIYSDKFEALEDIPDAILDARNRQLLSVTGPYDGSNGGLTWARVWSHANSGHQYGAVGESSYIPCGYSECSKCIKHEKMLVQLEYLKPNPIGEVVADMDVWELKNGQPAVAVLKPEVIKTLRELAVAESIPLEQFVDAYTAAVEQGHISDANPYVGEILSKANQKEFVTIVKVMKTINEHHATTQPQEAA